MSTGLSARSHFPISRPCSPAAYLPLPPQWLNRRHKTNPHEKSQTQLSSPLSGCFPRLVQLSPWPLCSPSCWELKQGPQRPLVTPQPSPQVPRFCLHSSWEWSTSLRPPAIIAPLNVCVSPQTSHSPCSSHSGLPRPKLDQDSTQLRTQITPCYTLDETQILKEPQQPIGPPRPPLPPHPLWARTALAPCDSMSRPSPKCLHPCLEHSSHQASLPLALALDALFQRGLPGPNLG